MVLVFSHYLIEKEAFHATFHAKSGLGCLPRLMLPIRPGSSHPNPQRFCNVQALPALVIQPYDIQHFTRGCFRSLAVELRGGSAGTVLEHPVSRATVAGRVRSVRGGASDRLSGSVAVSAQRFQDSQ